MTSQDHIDDSSAPLIEHLAELRNRLIWSVIAFFIAMALAYLVWNKIFNFLTVPMCTALAHINQPCQLVLIKLQEGFFVAVSIAVFGGFALSFPIIAYQLWRFVAPGLYRSEKNAILPFLIASPIMFFVGAAFCYYIVMPAAFGFLLSFQQGSVALTPEQADHAARASGAMAGVMFQGSVEEYLGLTMKFITAFGLCFQMPVLLTLLGRAGLITADGLASTRKYAVVAILVVAAIVTPPDALSQIILFVAIYPLYEVSIFLIRRIERRREAQARADGTWVDPDDDEDAAHG